ncbi:serine protease [Vibrio phage Va1]|nr:serine protease [Vibrio phage Va1]
MKKSILSMLSLAAVSTLSGCANGPMSHDLSVVDNSQIENTVKIFSGVPFLLGMEGSAARLNEDWMVTSAHNWPILATTGKWNFHKHPTCDIMLYKSKGENTVPVGTAFVGDTVTAVGYPMAAQPMAANQGTIVGNIKMEEYPECDSVATTSTISVGMSGGGVYNPKGELIGVVSMFTNVEAHWEDGRYLSSGGVYVHLKTVKNWIKEVTGEDFFNENAK